jgi:UDP-N-acetylmuramyl-tripeptide synthetase
LPIAAVTDRAQDCTPESLFVAIAGVKADGHSFLGEAAARGAKAALVGRRDVKAPHGMTLLTVPNTRRALALAAQHLAGDASRAMTVLGITGTKGKTTVSYLLEAIFEKAGLKSGILGTVNYRWNGHVAVGVAPQTTPSPMELARYFAQMKAEGVQAVAMEVSSHAIDQCRIDGIKFDAAALTNLTRDHLDYHQTVEQYIQAKERLFTEVLPASNPDAVSLLNLDDPSGRRFKASARTARTLGFSMFRREAELLGDQITFIPGGLRIDGTWQGEPIRLHTPMHGLFNVQNCLTAAGLALLGGIPLAAVQAGLASTHGAPGRFEPVKAGQPFPVIVDYAHTPDSLLQILLSARGLVQRRLIVVFGAGGDRDPGKRPLMGQAAARLADEVIVTNDNPRTENPQKIADAVAKGVRENAGSGLHWKIELDRRQAIREAIAMAREGDVVLIAGKGHENYQILGEKKIHFDDREEARAAVAELTQR